MFRDESLTLFLLSVYALLSVYLLVCSWALTIKAFIVCDAKLSPVVQFIYLFSSQNIPSELKNKTTTQVIETFFTPPVGALIAAMVSTFGIYLFASFLYVSAASAS